MHARDLADPSYEPTDEELRELMRRALADALARRDAAERAFRQHIAKIRAEALEAAQSASEGR
jgi:hypothetical protein